ncbi:hypothetical protein AALO_G00088830 [Alosa alosa]|uniref:Transmembrane protein 273 n=1 Tax=Alosa alosa TaxID=278164 RepID=A0AAV6H2W4_9TELE|nr:transmembrane protein 273-like isoform X1 [Alosa alosa]KAG5280412.1 hypothetical protein AALO_G00088830 [Alosa alosa]
MAHQKGALLVLTLLCLDSVLRGVRGDGVKENDQPERRYALIGAGVGLFLAIMFVAVKLCMIKRHMLDNGYHSAADDSVRSQSLRTQSTRLHRREAPDIPDQP